MGCANTLVNSSSQMYNSVGTEMWYVTLHAHDWYYIQNHVI